MRAAFVVMSILGCDATGIQCRAIATVDRQWPTIAACDAASDQILGNYGKVRYPLVVAVCQTAGTTALADSQADALENGGSQPSGPGNAPQPSDHKGFAARAIALLKRAIPTKEGIRSTLSLPVHIVTDTYSWVAREVRD